ncbi:MAG TPA: cation diffusion facilitator family transporter, partial [Acidobacteriota bacterium]|nr:cation diffusion facilitator family transporter [Acidobacteriota bacterium]
MPASGRAFAIGLSLNVLFVMVEFLFGFWSGSLALVADAGHNLTDVAGLLLAWAGIWLARQKPTVNHTYGFRRSTILAAFFNALLLIVTVGAIVWEALSRLKSPQAIHEGIVIGVAALGIVINTTTALFFATGQKNDLNLRGAFIHMAADAVVSLGVVLSGLLIWKTNWYWLDPVVSLVISVVILVSTIGLLRDSLNLALDAVPGTINIVEVRAYLLNLPTCREVHDLHIWAMSTTEIALTAHLVMDRTACNDVL